MLGTTTRQLALVVAVTGVAVICGCGKQVTGSRVPVVVSSDAALKDLRLSNGVFNHPFNPYDWVYQVQTDSSVAILSLTPIPNHRAATVAVNDIPVDGEEATVDVALTPGSNSIVVDVTAEDGKVNRYTLTVHRTESSNANLASLSVVGIDLEPGFDAAVTQYSAVVSHDVEQVAVVAEAVAADEGALVRFYQAGAEVTAPAAIALTDGTNVIEVVVFAPDDVTTKSYQLGISKQSNASDIALLAMLAVDGAVLEPAFDPQNTAQTEFAAAVGSGVSTIHLTATPVSAAATVEITLDSAAVNDPLQIPVVVGTNNILITVTAGDGMTFKEYTLAVTRPPAGASADLASIELTMGANGSVRPLYQRGFDPGVTGFDSAIDTYAAVIWGFDSITVTAVASDADVSSLTIDGGGEPQDGTTSQTVSLAQGQVHEIEIVVVSGDGSTSGTYSILVRLLNVYEFYYGIYAPVQRASKAQWYARVNDAPGLGLNEYYDGAEHGSMHWTITLAGLQGRNRMDFDHYNNGHQEYPYIDRGWSEHGRLESMLSLQGNGTQTGTLELFTHEDGGDKVGSLSYHIDIKSKQPTAGEDSYTDCTYMGETFRSYYVDVQNHDSLADRWDPYVPWTAGDSQ